LYLIIFEIFWTIGTIIEAGISWLVLPTLGWRWLLIFSAIPLFLIFLLFPIIPESPRYLLVSGQQEKLMETLKRVARWNGKPMPEGTIAPALSEKRGRILDLFSKQFRQLTFLLWGIWFFNNFVYYGLVLFTPEYFANADSNDFPLTVSDDVYLNVLITSIAELPGIFFASLAIDRLGRKSTQGSFFALCGVFTILLGLKQQAPRVLLTIFAVFSRLFIMGAFSATYVYTPEAYPTTIRGIGLGACTSLGRIAGIITPYIANVFVTFSNWVPTGLYAGGCIVAAILSYYLPYETSNKALLDVIEEEDTTKTLIVNNSKVYSSIESDIRYPLLADNNKA